MESEFRAGAVVGAYEIQGVVGSGGMGLVYRARHALSGRVAALKIQRSDQHELMHARERMMREAAILAQLGHPGVPRFFECGVLDERRLWIAMELVEGVALSRELARGPLEPNDVTALVAAVAMVLATAHAAGLTHRDLKPDNIVLTPDDPAFPLRVLDWGIAHHRAGARYTNHDEAIGTPTYMAPEQARGGPTAGHCDVYSLGVIAYHALTGEPPFVGTNPVEILLQHFNRPAPPLAPRCPEAPYGLVELVERMLAKKYAQRPTASQIHETLCRQHAESATPAYLEYALDAVEAIDPTTERTTAPMRVRS